MFGYLKDTETSRIVSKAVMPDNDQTVRSGFQFVECTKAELEAVEVYREIDPDKQKEAADKAAIDAAMEELAIERAEQGGHVFQSPRLTEKAAQLRAK